MNSNRFWALAAGDEIFDPLGLDKTLLRTAKMAMCDLKDMRDIYRAAPNAARKDILFLTLRSSLRAFPRDPALWHFAGKLAEEYHFPAEALALHENGLRFAPDDQYLLMSAAQLARHLGQTDKARLHVERLIAVNKTEVKSLGLATQVELAAGDIVAARDYARQRLRIAPTDPVALGHATQVELAAGDMAAARDYARQRLRIAPTDPVALGHATQVELAAGDMAAARDYARQGLRIAPDNPVALGLATQVELAAGDMAAARGYARQGLRIAPTDPVALGLATQVELAAGDMAAARDYARQRLRIAPTDPVALGLATQVELAAGDIVAARDYARQRLRIAPDNPVALGLAMQIELNTDDADAALNLAAAAPEKIRKDKVIAYFTAKAHLFKGEIGKVLAIVTPLIQNHPDSAFTSLYMACIDKKDEIAMFRPLLGEPAFERMWANSRALKLRAHDLPHERELFFGHSFWNTAATTPIAPRSAIPQMAGVPATLRRALGGYDL